MASFTDYIECSTCGGVKYYEDYYKIGEYRSHCLRCGAVENYVLSRDEDGNVIYNGKHPVFEHENIKGYGTFTIYSKEGFGQAGTFNDPINEETIKEFKAILDQDGVDKEKSFVLSWDGKEANLVLGKEIPEINKLSFKEWSELTLKEPSEDELSY